MGALLFRSSSCVLRHLLSRKPALASCSPRKAAPIPPKRRGTCSRARSAVRGEDEEVEPDSEHLAVVGDRLPVDATLTANARSQGGLSIEIHFPLITFAMPR
jgi:hypothetical protein